ncbi:hypothetical protein N658DRAFT_222188 [Parathielavia hyrcaniae]|uniref:CRIB domain-containing protein n=1 Tax=Parathielavia hyrcaniae TaxID=113614 RepID=A0AAN6PUW4_9PEZI|nr:hypothetical protein N658DRAFT_222188 [Parathielavia hyrcaniae]
MNRFNFFARPGGGAPHPTTTTTITTTTNRYHNDMTLDDPYDDRAPLSPRSDLDLDHEPAVLPDVLEAQPTTAATATAAHEMAERNRGDTPPTARFLHRFRPAIPSFFSTARTSAFFGSHDDNPQSQPPQQQGGFLSSSSSYPRPTSSAYSGEGLRGAPGTVVNQGENGAPPLPTSPKSPDYHHMYHIGADDLRLPGTRLHLPELERSWTQESNSGPPTRPGTGGSGERGGRGGGGGAAAAGVAVPEAAVVREAGGRTRRHGSDGQHQHRERRRRRRRGERSGERSGSGSGSGGSGRSGSHRSGSDRDRSGSHRSRDGESRSERRERRRRREGERGSRTRTKERRPPKNFLFCFPWVKSRRIRSHILRCFVSGLFLALTLAICKCNNPLRDGSDGGVVS